jgi:hypothetical protein
MLPTSCYRQAHLLSPVAAILGVVIFGSLAQAASLLAEFKWSQPFAVTLPGDYSVSARGFGFQQAGWLETVTSFPHTSHAPPGVVAAFHVPMWSEIADFQMWNDDRTVPGSVPCATCRLHRLIGSDSEEFAALAAEQGWQVSMYVPLLGSAFEGYQFTDIERIVTADAQTIRFYGVVLPEPASWLLVAHISMLGLLGRLRRRSLC